ncbi:hypothetical protein DYQ93_11665 [Xanthomonas sp. LMG 8992]|uniref:hypothetical protein n=1 Tax=Xanthomonas sp. LMG 8992 TaxID=1591157 RepID=UPI0013686ADB|nr:hypothetical protein [Xanthomonas sp. LMG 8992]MXV11678.1 hypothetical protein [Xanthomonas sp. LMG 8992]
MGWISKPLVKAIRKLAHGQKGLDQDTYRMHLRAVGATSTLEITREQHHALLQRLCALPDKPKGRAAR